MQNNKSPFNKRAIVLAPGKRLEPEFVNQIKKLNSDKPDFPTYKRRVENLFHLKTQKIDNERLHFLAGFIEGEASISISIKKNNSAIFGVELDPVFNLTQHINGVNHLYLALAVFQTGRIRHKSGSNATLVFVIEPRKSLQEKVCPFYEKYVNPFSSPAKQIRYTRFKQMLELFDSKAHLDKNIFINELLPIWDSLRCQAGYQGQPFKSLIEAQNFVSQISSSRASPKAERETAKKLELDA